MGAMRFERWPGWLKVVVPVGVVLVGYGLGKIDIGPVKDDQLLNWSRLAAIVGGVVAVTSLVSTAISTGFATRRQRRQDTIEAWTAWSDGNTEHRKLLFKHLGSNQLSPDQAKGLLDRDHGLIDRNGNTVSPEIRADIKHAQTAVLNGLERLAAGVNFGVYDELTIRELGGSIIVSQYDRAMPYIDLRRSTERVDLRQKRVFTALEGLVNSLKKTAIDDELDRDRINRARNV
jgi:hypothetical protein